MSTVEDISLAVRKLPKKDLVRFRRWFEKYDADEWDSQIERDAATGKLDAMARRALRELRIGQAKEL
jgi:hypothetical protein